MAKDHTQSSAPELPKKSKKISKKWSLLLLTGAALALIPRRSSRHPDAVLHDLATKDATDADK